MSEPPIAAAREARAADDRITTEREETKYLVPTEELDALLAEITRKLPRHRFAGEGANRLPDAQHFVTTVYFDTPSRAHFRLAKRNASTNVKIRAKDYYDVHPALAEIVTSAEQAVRHQPWVWLELKSHDGPTTSKRRFRTRKRELPAFLERGQVRPGLLADATDEFASAGVREIVEYRERLGEPLAASSVVNYRRLSWQDPEAGLRVTVDVGLAFYPPPEDLWTSERPLVRLALGRARHMESYAVLEVKRLGSLPSWLESALSRARLSPVSFSKFVAASEAVHGPC